MATAIKLYRIGKKNQPIYRIVVSNKRYKANGKYIEEIGHYNPLKKTAFFYIKKERFKYWVNNGAQLSEGIKKLLKNFKI